MKVLIIAGSPRGRETQQVAERLTQRLTELGGVEVETVKLKDINLQMCRGCEACVMRDDRLCPNKDDRQAVVDRMMAADGLILISPVYSFTVSALKKNFIDRLTYIIHRPRFFHKKALVVVTSGGLAAPTLKYMKSVVKAWGCDFVGQLGVVHPDAILPAQLEKQMRNIDRAAERFHQALTASRTPSPSLIDLIWFRVWRSNAELFRLPPDYEYWQSHGWLKRDYYYDVPLNPFALALARLIGRLMPAFAKKMYKTTGDSK